MATGTVSRIQLNTDLHTKYILFDCNVTHKAKDKGMEINAYD
jgi:hypothetical protein